MKFTTLIFNWKAERALTDRKLALKNIKYVCVNLNHRVLFQEAVYWCYA